MSHITRSEADHIRERMEKHHELPGFDEVEALLNAVDERDVWHGTIKQAAREIDDFRSELERLREGLREEARLARQEAHRRADRLQLLSNGADQ